MTEPDPRFTLANERTALAWVRTGLAFVAAGLGASAATQVLDLNAFVAAAGMTSVLIGAALTIAAARRWRVVQQALEADRDLPVNRLVPMAAAGVVVVAALGVATALVEAVG